MKKQYYGISSKDGEIKYVAKFADRESAERWLRTEEYDFREREIMGKTAAIKVAGKDAVENAVDL